MTGGKRVALVFFSLVLAVAAGSLLIRPAEALGVMNTVGNAGFENNEPSAACGQSTPAGFWCVTATYGGGNVKINDTSQPHSGSYSAMLNAVNTTLTCSTPPECKDSVRATVQQYIQFNSPPTLNNLAPSDDSFAAWWYVADPSSTIPTYSLHIGVGFSDGSSIEYYYGISDLTNQRYNLGPIPATGSWFQMRRNLLSDIQGVVSNPSSTKITTLWFGAFGGTYQSTPHGERAWVDDAALNFNTGPVAIFSSSPTSGPAPLAVRFDATHSFEIPGPSTTASVASYTWNFGDGSSNVTLTSPITNHIYGGTGTFQVTLVVTDSANVKSNPLTSSVVVNPSDVTVPLALAGGGGLLLVGGLFFTRFRRRPSRVVKPKQRFRKG